MQQNTGEKIHTDTEQEIETEREWQRICVFHKICFYEQRRVFIYARILHFRFRKYLFTNTFYCHPYKLRRERERWTVYCGRDQESCIVEFEYFNAYTYETKNCIEKVFIFVYTFFIMEISFIDSMRDFYLLNMSLNALKYARIFD